MSLSPRHFARPALSQGQTRPNIILIQADDLGYGDLSAYGQAKFSTPGIDRLAREGIRFTNYYSGSTVCAPSRAALMTGMHTGHAWIRGNGEIPLRPDDVTVAMLLRDAGYRTAVIGKWGLGHWRARPGSRTRRASTTRSASSTTATPTGSTPITSTATPSASPVDLNRDYVNDLFTREAESFITRDRLRSRSSLPELHRAARRAAGAGRFAGAAQGPLPARDAVRQRRRRRPARPARRPTARSLGYRSQPTPRAAFVAMITRMDRDIARLTDLLGERKIDRNTLIMFVSDNGPHHEGGADPDFFHSSGGLRGIKRDLYEGGIRVPMVARWVGTIPAGRVSYHEWAHWDMLPTLTELAGAKTPAGIDGMSMARALKGQQQPTHEFMYWEFHERGFQQAVRMGHWKAVRLKKDAPLELYDLPERSQRTAQCRGRPTPTSSRRSRSTSRRRGPSRRAGRSSSSGCRRFTGYEPPEPREPSHVTSQIFLLSPANCGGRRATMVMSERATFELATRLRTADGAPLGERVRVLSGLYFRGKLAYCRAFARPPDPASPISGAGSFVITPNAGLRSVDTPVTIAALRNFAGVDIDVANPKYRRPLEVSARAIAEDIGPDCAVVLLGSIASPKYVDVLQGIFGAATAVSRRFRRPRRHEPRRPDAAVGHGGRGAAYIPVAGAVRHGVRPPKLIPLK